MILILILQTPKTLTLTLPPTKYQQAPKYQQAQPIEEAKTKATTPPMVRDP